MSWFQEISRMCEHFGADFDQVVDFVGSTEREGKQPRPIYHPGVIGGHCIIPNAEKLESLYRSKFVEALLESNKKRAEEESRREAIGVSAEAPTRRRRVLQRQKWDRGGREP
ncbi:MAG TPA: hypothetical protein VJR06_00825, partial [Nitrososphaerales archaeon]|nr:hypothetical protein [Nitrososphaerales archaeon]